jgi:hypothetical protein
MLAIRVESLQDNGQDNGVHTFTKPVVSSPNRSDRAKHSPGGKFRSFMHAATNLNAAAFGLFASDIFSSTCSGSAGRREL